MPETRPAGAARRLVQEPGADRFVMRGRAMDSWPQVAPEGVTTESALRSWLAHGVGYARSLPPK